jgi:hypothetical protein
MDISDLKKRFSLPTVDKTQEDKMKNIRMNLLNLAILIDELSPDSREKSLSITSLEKAMFWANASVSRNGGK